MNEKVSIVLPIYNQEQYLDISLPSVMNQTWRNLEIIAVNDGSTDASPDLIAKYAAQDPRFVTISKPNGGVVDAVIAGIEAATGTYIAFVDPDDVVCPTYIERFMDGIQDADLIAMGFFQNDGNCISEYRLNRDAVYTQDALRELKRQLQYDGQSCAISKNIFISRWNKLYRASVVRQIVPDLKQMTDVSLGEDTLFTFLVLNYCSKIVCCSEPNGYVYNTDSANSMMRTGQADAHIQKAKKVYLAFLKWISKYDPEQGRDQAVALYYFQCSDLLSRTNDGKDVELSHAYKCLHTDPLYNMGRRLVRPRGVRESIKRLVWLLPTYGMYSSVRRLAKDRLIPFLRNGKQLIKEPVKILNDVKTVGLQKASRLSYFRARRRLAFRELDAKLPELEQQIQPILEKWKGKTTDFDSCPIEKNVFVFWWDGFENSPRVVRQCLRSVKENHAGYRVIEIDKTNYQQYTDIHPALLAGFRDGKISIQTFSDILRFNLLKNHGGIWIDATIFFSRPFDLLSGLENNSVNSVVFNSSKYFLRYRGECCTWSGFYFAARKNAVLVCAMNDIFESYYLKYQNYPIYFFIDAALMLCKRNKIDADALSGTHQTWADMFFLGNNLNSPYSVAGDCLAGLVPQKLAWFARIDSAQTETYYGKIVNERYKAC